MKSIFILLGLCSGFVPNDIVMSNTLCEFEIRAKLRDIKPSDPLPARQGFGQEVAKVCWPRSRCNHE